MTMSDAHLERLERRGLDIELASRRGLETVQRGGGDALALPFLRKGQLVRRKYRRFDVEEGKWTADKGGLRIPFNEDALRDDSLVAQPLIITEGEFDQLAAEQAGFRRSISVPDGAPPPGERDLKELEESAKYAWLKDPELHGLLSSDRVKEIIIAADGDENGGALLHDLSHLLMRSRCKYLVYPLAPEKHRERLGRDRCKDLNEVLEFYGVKGVQKTIENAQFIKVKGIYRMSELPPLPPMQIFQNRRLQRFGSEHYKVRLGDFVVITAVPGMGKTTWANDFYCEVALEHGLKIAWASFEQTPQRDHKRALRSWYGVRDDLEETGRLGRRLKDMTPAEIADADAWIDDQHVFIVPDEDDDVDLDWMLDRMEAAVIQHGVKIIVIDPWNEMDHVREHGESATEYVGRAIKRMKRFAKKFQIHLVIIAHPTKSLKDANGNYKMPTLYDISDSANWYNKCDLGIIVHKESENETLIKVQKSKYWDVIGRPGEVIMAYCAETRRYVETGRCR